MMVLLYIPFTIILAAIDSIRIKRVWGKVGNINHWLSYLLAFAGIAALYFIVKPSGWHIAAFILECVLIRAVFFAPALNLCRREKLDYESSSTNAITDGWKVGFWVRELIASVALAIVLIIDNIFK